MLSRLNKNIRDELIDYPVTNTIILICVVIWITSCVLFQVYGILISDYLTTSNLDSLSLLKRLSCLFVHLYIPLLPMTYIHIFLNISVLRFVGIELESKWGSTKFFLFFLACGLGASLISQELNSLSFLSYKNGIGVSGALFGLLVALAIEYPDIKFSEDYESIRSVVITYCCIELTLFILSTFVLPYFGLSSSIGHGAHLGGAFTGLILIYLMRSSKAFID